MLIGQLYKNVLRMLQVAETYTTHSSPVKSVGDQQFRCLIRGSCIRGVQAGDCFTLYAHLQAFLLHPIKLELGVWRQCAASCSSVDRKCCKSPCWKTLQQALHIFCRHRRQVSACVLFAVLIKSPKWNTAQATYAHLLGNRTSGSHIGFMCSSVDPEPRRG